MGAEGNDGGSVELYSADLTMFGAYDDACANAQAVIHAAAQVDPFVVKDPIKDMVEPSTEGVRNILSSVNKCPHIKHFVQTSSMAAVGGSSTPVDESHWNTQGMEGWEQAPALAYSKFHPPRTAQLSLCRFTIHVPLHWLPLPLPLLLPPMC